MEEAMKVETQDEARQRILKTISSYFPEAGGELWGGAIEVDMSAPGVAVIRLETQAGRGAFFNFRAQTVKEAGFDKPMSQCSDLRTWLVEFFGLDPVREIQAFFSSPDFPMRPTDDEFAAELLRRLQAMTENPDVLRDLSELLKVRIPASQATQDHPSIICGDGTFSAFGILNGLCGPPITEGRGKGVGRLMRYVNDEGDETIRFWLSKDEPPADIEAAEQAQAREWRNAVSEPTEKPVVQRDPAPPVDTWTAGRNILLREQAAKIHLDVLKRAVAERGPRDSLTDADDLASEAVTHAEALVAELAKRGRL